MSDQSKPFFSIMLIDDNEIDNLINQKMLESANICEKIYVHSGAKSAIEFLRNLEKIADVAPHVLPALIFLDIDMPLMDGFQFLELFDQLNEQTRNSCKVIMLTSSISPQDTNRSKEFSYIKTYLNKPLTFDAINSLTSLK